MIYGAYPVKKGKVRAMTAISKDLALGEDAEAMIKAVKAFAKAECPKPHAGTYFHQRRWADEDNGKDFDPGGFEKKGPKPYQPPKQEPCTLPPDYAEKERQFQAKQKEGKP
jgi:hypothetical protein